MATKTAKKTTKAKTKSATKPKAATSKSKAAAKPKATAAKKAPVKPKTVAKKAKAPAKPKPVAKKAKAAAKPKAASKKTPVTTIRAQVDVGFGNSLFIRGNGGGLSWEQGTPMDWVDGDWVWSSASVNGAGLEFKFLLNDEAWSEGENESLKAGETSISTPSF